MFSEHHVSFGTKEMEESKKMMAAQNSTKPTGGIGYAGTGVSGGMMVPGTPAIGSEEGLPDF
jgi:hypothetical protein